MRFTQRAARLIIVAITAVALMASATSASSAPSMAPVPKGCITLSAAVGVGRAPDGIAANPTTNTIYVANWHQNTVSVVSGRANTVIATIPVGRGPASVTANPKTGTIYTANVFGNKVSVLTPCPK